MYYNKKNHHNINGDFMELKRKTNNKFSNVNPSCIKENNSNLVNIFDTSLRSKKNYNDGFNEAVKLKRNFK